jgi:tetratricopeptide (TPR) repeat protein
VYEGDALSTANEAEPAYALYQESMAIRAKLWGPQSVKLARERYQLAIVLWAQGRLQQALKELKQAEQDMSAAMGAEHTNTLVITLQRGRLEVQIDMSPEGMKRLRHAADMLIQRRAELDARTHFDAVYAIGESLQSTGDIQSAKAYLEEALRLAQSLRGQLPVNGGPDSDLAANLQDLGDYSSARSLLTDAIQRVSKNLSIEHAQVLNLKDSLAALAMAESMAKGIAPQPQVVGLIGPAELLLLGRPYEALTLAQSRWQKASALPVADQTAVARYIVNDQLARALAATGRCEAASSRFVEALQALKNAHPDSPYLMLARARLSRCEWQMGHFDEARHLERLVLTRLNKPGALGRHLIREAQSQLRH